MSDAIRKVILITFKTGDIDGWLGFKGHDNKLPQGAFRQEFTDRVKLTEAIAKAQGAHQPRRTFMVAGNSVMAPQFEDQALDFLAPLVV